MVWPREAHAREQIACRRIDHDRGAALGTGPYGVFGQDTRDAVLQAGVDRELDVARPIQDGLDLPMTAIVPMTEEGNELAIVAAKRSGGRAGGRHRANG